MTARNERATRSFGVKVAIGVAVLFVVPILLKAGGCLPARVQIETTTGPDSKPDQKGPDQKAPPAQAERKNLKGND